MRPYFAAPAAFPPVRSRTAQTLSQTQVQLPKSFSARPAPLHHIYPAAHYHLGRTRTDHCRKCGVLYRLRKDFQVVKNSTQFKVLYPISIFQAQYSFKYLG